LIKSKHINFEKKPTNPCPLISRILNSKSLSTVYAIRVRF
jgi:hypothetical protein